MTTATKGHVPTRDFPDFGRDEPQVPPAPVQTSGTDVFRRIPLERLRESPLNPRKTFDPAKLKELAQSLLASGQLQPLIVRPWPGEPGAFEIGAGHRRLRAARSIKTAHFDALDCIVREMDDRAMRELITFENLGHDDLHALDEAEGFASAMKELGYSVEQIGDRSGKGARYVYDSLTLRKLTPEAKKLFRAGRFERSHAVELARLSPKQQDEILQTEPSWNGGALFVAEDVEEDPTASKQEQLELRDAVKPVTVRELKHYINDHYRARPDQVDPVLFPETAEQLAAAAAAKRKVVYITYDHQVPYAARDPKTKTVGKHGWKRADGKFGSKTCAHAVLGFVPAGPHRQEAFLVCINKEKCEVHWRDWQRESARRKKEYARQRPNAAQTAAVPIKTPAAAPKPRAPAFEETKEGQAAIQAVLKIRALEMAKAVRRIRALFDGLSDVVVWNLAEWVAPELDERPSWNPVGRVGGRPFGQTSDYQDELERHLFAALPALPHGSRAARNADGARTQLAWAIYFARDFDHRAFDRDVLKAAQAAAAADMRNTKKAPAPKKAVGKKKAKKGQR